MKDPIKRGNFYLKYIFTKIIFYLLINFKIYFLILILRLFFTT